MNIQTIQEIREKERLSHIQAYSSQTLFQDGWLRKPVKTVMSLLPLLNGKSEVSILDLGSGVGRNAIPMAQYFAKIPCRVDCVDLLDLAIEKLLDYAEKYDVKTKICPHCLPIEDFIIPKEAYDLILAVSSLEHIDSEIRFTSKLLEIQQGLKPEGIVCLIINSQVTEQNTQTGHALMPQFELNFPTNDLLQKLDNLFSGFSILCRDVRHQSYSIPRDATTSLLSSNVITFAAQK